MLNSSQPRIRTFNPGTFQTDAELREQFVVRTDAFTTVLDILRGNTTSPLIDSPRRRHILVTGRRGHGKTMLLARVAAELREHDSERLIPVRFMEESYEIFTLNDFWLDVLLYLALEIATSDPTRSKQLLSTRQVLAKDCQGASLADRARDEVLNAAAGRTLVLMVENLQDLCTSVDDDFESELRALLLAQRRIVLLATAVNPFALRHHNLFPTTEHSPAPVALPWSLEQSPLYELFRLVDLQPLDKVGCRLLWTTVTGTQLPMPTEAPRDPARALQILTGGNPRLLVMVASLVRHRSLNDFTEALVDLVDSHTDYFRGQLDSLAKTERRVYLAVVDIWKPSTPSQISERARIDVRTVSAMLARLAARGMVFRTNDDGTAVNSTKDRRSKNLYFAADGLLYNAYYKLRRERDAGFIQRTVVHFMTAFYSRAQLPSELHDEMYDAVLSETERDQNFRRHDVTRDPNDYDPFSTKDVFAEPDQIRDTALPGDGDGTVVDHSYPDTSDIITAQRMLANARSAAHGKAAPLYDEILHRFGDSTSAAIHEVLAQTLFHTGSYRRLFLDFRNSAAPGVQALVAKAMYLRGRDARESALEKTGAAVAIWRWSRLINRYSDSAAPQVLEQVANALLDRADAFVELMLHKKAIDSCLECERLLEHRTEPELKFCIARSLHGRLMLAASHGNHEEALCLSSEIVRRYEVHFTSQIPKPYSSAEYELWEIVRDALSVKVVVCAKQGDFISAIRACDEILQRWDRNLDVVDFAWVDGFAHDLIDKGIYQARLGKREEAMATWWEVVRRLKPLRSSFVCPADEDAMRLLCVTNLELGRVKEAASIHDAYLQDTKWSKRGRLFAAGYFFFELRMLWARLTVGFGKSRRTNNALRSAAEEFRAVYARFDPGNDTMTRMILSPVIDLIATGACEREVLEILVSDEKKSAALWPLVVALQQRLGESVHQPVEVIAIAADINEQIENRKAEMVTRQDVSDRA